jgi:hypothetical protein
LFNRLERRRHSDKHVYGPGNNLAATRTAANRKERARTELLASQPDDDAGQLFTGDGQISSGELGHRLHEAIEANLFGAAVAGERGHFKPPPGGELGRKFSPLTLAGQTESDSLLGTLQRVKSIAGQAAGGRGRGERAEQREGGYERGGRQPEAARPE